MYDSTRRASTRRRVDVSARRRVQASTRRRVDMSRQRDYQCTLCDVDTNADVDVANFDVELCDVMEVDIDTDVVVDIVVVAVSNVTAL